MEDDKEPELNRRDTLFRRDSYDSSELLDDKMSQSNLETVYSHFTKIGQSEGRLPPTGLKETISKFEDNDEDSLSKDTLGLRQDSQSHYGKHADTKFLTDSEYKSEIFNQAKSSVVHLNNDDAKFKRIKEVISKNAKTESRDENFDLPPIILDLKELYSNEGFNSLNESIHGSSQSKYGLSTSQNIDVKLKKRMLTSDEIETLVDDLLLYMYTQTNLSVEEKAKYLYNVGVLQLKHIKADK